MEYIAQWGPKGFLVSPEKIVPFDGFSYSVALKSDSENDTSGKAPTNTRGLELKTINLSTTYVKGAGVDPRGQIVEWESLVGSSHPLYIGGERFGPNRMILKKIDVSDIRTNNSGAFLIANVAMSFEEDPTVETQNTQKNSKKKALKTTATPVAKKNIITGGGGSRIEYKTVTTNEHYQIRG